MDKRKELSNLNDYQIRQFRKYFKELENLVEEFSEELNDKRDNLVEELIWLIESNHIFSLPNVIFIIV